MVIRGPINWDQLSDLQGEIRRVIIHVYRNPETGVWAMMKQLAAIQNQQVGTVSILGILADDNWRKSSYMQELIQLGLPHLISRVPTFTVFGTVAYVLLLIKNPLRTWITRSRRALPEAEIIVHSHAAWLSSAYLPLPNDHKTSMVATFHGIADDKRLRRIVLLRAIHRFFAHRLYRSGATLTAVSRETAARAETIFGMPVSAFHIVPNGLEDKVLAVLPKKDEQFVVAHVGQMHQGKGWHFLIEAVDKLHQEGYPISLILAGTGEDSHLAEQAAAKREYVQYLGYVSMAGETLIPTLDALVLATWSEGMPMSVIEAFAAGVPVLSTRVGGLPEMIVEGENGLFIDRDPDSIRQGLKQLLMQPDFTKQLRLGARRTFEERYNILKVTEAYTAVYDTAIQQEK